ncbi:putative molybdopterin binding protein [Orenia metallireducens]|uniref:Molybdopterin molybdenumtransferase n=1 Tax=Orenia metallireducens TaxID=1413210 RepID=A0A285GGK8_9FIRM|nr:molybdopterin-binding protein [Orenia metallireducens]PRX30439.1 putative molybdopterin binding protein [Orenia metallireducens]SNY22558.1 Probable molybdopterin binding domain-containing protein [Orenia metallireducens]
MEKVKVEDAVGMILGHDMTQVIPGEFKGVRFKKGHLVQKEDIPVLKSMGKDHIYLMELGDDECHEEEAANRIAQAIAGQGVSYTQASEGKVTLKAEYGGLLKVDVDLLYRLNNIEDVTIATLHNNTVVEAKSKLAGTRIIPLKTAKGNIEEVEELSREKELLRIKPFIRRRIGVIITGNEVYYGRIEDKFASVFKSKAAEYNLPIEEVIYAPDDPQRIAEAIQKLVETGIELILTGGGMSVDPDDVTPTGIKASGARIESYGAPVLPGSMFMVAYLGEVAILGTPACAMFNKRTILDLILPRVLAGEEVSREDIIALGHGGLCRSCQECNYPICPVGKGV